MRSDLSVKGKRKANAIPEPFFFISLDINEKYDVDASLENYFQSEVLDDYMVGKKLTEASSTWNIVKAPNNLLLHVKRFYFDNG